MLSGIHSDILSNILSGIHSDILSGIHSDILSNILSCMSSEILCGRGQLGSLSSSSCCSGRAGTTAIKRLQLRSGGRGGGEGRKRDS